MTETVPVNPGHYVELMDRCHVVATLVEEVLYRHPALTPEMQGRIDQVLELLGEVYQWAGNSAPFEPREITPAPAHNEN